MSFIKRLIPIAFIFSLCIPAWSAIELVQEVKVNKAGGVNNFINLSPSASGSGHLFVIAFISGATNSIPSVNDNQTSAWQIPAAARGTDNGTTGASVQFAYTYNTTANISSVTIHCANTNVVQATLYEFSGVQTSSDPLDDAEHINLQSITSPTASYPPILQSGSNGLFLSQVAISAANITGVGSPFTYDAVAIQVYQGVAYLMSADSSNHTPAWANPSNQSATFSGISFKAATAPSVDISAMELVF